MHKVFITGQIEENGIELLRKKGFKVDIVEKECVMDAQLREIFSAYDAVVTMVCDKIDEDLISHASSGKLKIIANYGVGFDNIDVLAAKRKGIVVANTPGVAGESVAEHSFALILACSKHLIEADRFVRQGHYHRFDPKAFLSPQLWGKTIGIIGLGRIGTYVGHIAFGGFKMKILYSDIARSEDFEMLTEAKYVPMNALLKEADFVSLHAPLTPQTKHMIGREQFKMMKKEAVFVNTARGAIVDEQALIWALKEKVIAAAGLDVYENEAQISAELRALSNVVLTPHTASATTETREEMSRIAAQNIIDVFSGKTPFGLVTVS
jgi:glyoxylate reductase